MRGRRTAARRRRSRTAGVDRPDRDDHEQADRNNKNRRGQRRERTLTILLVVSRLLPVAVQIVLVATAVQARSWVLAVMSATSLALSIATAAQSLITLDLRGRRSGPVPGEDGRELSDAAAEAGQRPEADGMPGTVDARTASSCAITSVPLAALLADDGRAGTMMSASDADLWRRCVRSWRANRTESRSLCARIGTGADGRACTIDLIGDGPHALVAGTTGSGKSVLLEAWCSALALTYPPSRLNFVFLDFKGGATFRDLRRLPQTVGSVSDLSLARARRALDGLERELRRRERLLAGQDVDRLDRLGTPPPRLVVVVDEFNALRTSLPDYLPRLARIASQGRSLGIHLVLATQSPSIEVPRSIQANIGTDICLRVRDPLQSADLVGTRAAAWLRQDRPGTAIMHSGAGQTLFRAARPPRRCVEICELAGRFCRSVTGQGPDAPRRLFTDPLPHVCHLEDIPPDQSDRGDVPAHVRRTGRQADGRVCIGLADDGVATRPAFLDVTAGNIAVCGPPGRGKSTLCALVHRQAPSVMAVEEEDGLLDPLADTAGARQLRRCLQDRQERTIYAVRDPRLVRYPSQCAIRVFFPTGDKAADMLAGIPAQALAGWEQEDLSCPGRALVCDGAGWTTVQIIAPDR